MQKVVPVDIRDAGKAFVFKGFVTSNSGYGPGSVEKIIGPGKYLIAMQSGQKVLLQGPRALKVGTQVRVTAPSRPMEPKGVPESNKINSKESGIQWTAFIPLGFGGKGAAARLRVFVERKKDGPLSKNSPAVYFVFTVETEKQGEIQWSIYLKGRQVAIQVFSGLRSEGDLKDLIGVVERNLKSKGFVLSGPTVVLARPFKVPEGFHLNVKG